MNAHATTKHEAENQPQINTNLSRLLLGFLRTRRLRHARFFSTIPLPASAAAECCRRPVLKACISVGKKLRSSIAGYARKSLKTRISKHPTHAKFRAPIHEENTNRPRETTKTKGRKSSAARIRIRDHTQKYKKSAVAITQFECYTSSSTGYTAVHGPKKGLGWAGARKAPCSGH